MSFDPNREPARRIKRYGGRRLYDPGLPGYVTADELRTLVSKGAAVVVTDAETRKDVTREVLGRLH